ncbi:MAG: hypothetical protein NC041_06965 [Bacteroides sp.]|nr:hypothetical protein [Prevotella sp.]MCM1407037.1 hypothetical protein [Treponema brennaborense]MCM1470189.1 hypothetical protein [Bacteroides sp.]
MLKQIPNRITYAQKKIIELTEERKLRKWCQDNGLQHSTIYRIGIGEQIPTYKIVCSMVHLIPAIEWLYYTDEKLPFKPVLIPAWNPENKCKFIKEHRYDYKEIAKKYGLSELSAYNICVASRAQPSLAFIRECCKDVNPIDFFIDGEEVEVPKKFFPDRGDIVNIQGNIVLVLSKKQDIENTNYLICSPVLAKCENSVELTGTKTKGFVCARNLKTFVLAPRCQASFIESVSSKDVNAVLAEARAILK